MHNLTHSIFLGCNEITILNQWPGNHILGRHMGISLMIENSSDAIGILHSQEVGCKTIGKKREASSVI